MSFLSDSRIVARALDRFYRLSANRKGRVISQAPIEDLVAGLGLHELARQGGLRGRRLARFLDRYLESCTRLHHPAYMAHQVAVPVYAGALAALVDGFTNNAMAIYEMGPAGAAIEFFVLNWMIEKVGWIPAPYPRESSAGTHAGGVLTHGGSLANLTALLAARTHLAPDSWEKGSPANLAVLAPAESHYSIARAAGLLGIGREALYPLEVDANGRVIPDRIPAAFARVEADARRPMALVANACSTALGLYDRLPEIAQACRARGVWLHVDGAHGASALLSERHRALLRGVEAADSLVWDAHKLMRTPTLCAAVLVRDSRTLDGAFQQEASYLFYDKEQPGVDFIHRTVECTKAALGLRFFAVLAALGETGLARYVERQFALAREAHSFIASLPDFECPAPPETNILCFRIRGDDALQVALRDALIAEGSFHLSTAEHNGRRWLRASFMNPDTSLQDVQRMTARVREIAAARPGTERRSGHRERNA
jgi:L-2,4-diaminobutyrate decarboxylase